MAATSRPDDHDLPSPRQTTARMSGRPLSSARMAQSWASMSSSKALCFSTLLLVMTAMDPLYSRSTVPMVTQAPTPGHGWPVPVGNNAGAERSRSGLAGRRSQHERAAGRGERISMSVRGQLEDAEDGTGGIVGHGEATGFDVDRTHDDRPAQLIDLGHGGVGIV